MTGREPLIGIPVVIDGISNAPEPNSNCHG
jgi:hypothetical protein